MKIEEQGIHKMVKIFLILGCNGINVLVVILHYNFATSSY